MKIRNGFVSNSSSSSFIIAFKTDACACCGRKDDVKAMFNNSYNESGLEILDIEKVFDKIEYCIDYGEPEEDVKERERVKKLAADCNDVGYTFAYARVDHNESGLMHVIETSPTIKVLWGND